MTVMMLSLFLFSEDVYGIEAGADLGFLAWAYRVASAVLSLPVVLLLGIPIAKRAVRTLKSGRFSMDLLIVAGAFAAYGISIYSIAAGRRGVYFDSASSALLLSTLGRYLEAVSRTRASRLLGPSLRRSSEPVKVLGKNGFEEKAPALIAPSDRLLLATEDIVPVDARLLEGPVEVSLGVLTGESVPLIKNAGDEIAAGAIIVSGPAHLMALRTVRESTLERLSDLAMKLSAKSTSLERWADRFASVLTPMVVVIAIVTLVFHSVRASTEEGVIAALAVVLSACPCTYGVATPLVFWLTLRKALLHGVLIRSASTLEALSRVRAVAFDKTGTLTDSTLSVDKIEMITPSSGEKAESLREVLMALVQLEEGSRHPVGSAIFDYAKAALHQGNMNQPCELIPEADKQTFRGKVHLPGKGVRAIGANGDTWLLGSQSWLTSMGVLLDSSADDTDRVRVLLAKSEAAGTSAASLVPGTLPPRCVARIHVGEKLRKEAKAAVDQLATLGIATFVLTGDSASSATVTTSSLGMEAYAGLSAEDKVQELAKRAQVAMVGDGMNDGPALAGATTSFAMFGGTDLARGMAQISLLTPDLRLVPWTIALAKQAFSIARTNLIASTVYNLLFLGLASFGLLRPVWAGISMATASLLMLASASRMRSFQPPFEGDEVPEPFVIANGAPPSFAEESPA